MSGFKKWKIFNYIGLISIVILSFLSIASFEYLPKGEYNEDLDNFKLVTPGILFSLFLIILFRKHFSFGRLIIYFFILVIGYSINLIIAMSSWGFAVPVSGLLGGLLIKILFSNGKNLHDANDPYIIIGLMAGVLGLVIHIAASNFLSMGSIFGIIIIIWQLLIGAEAIKNKGEI